MKLLLDKDRFVAAKARGEYSHLYKNKSMFIIDYEKFNALRTLVNSVHENFPNESQKTFEYFNSIVNEDFLNLEIKKHPVMFQQMFGLIAYWFEQKYIDEDTLIKSIFDIKHNYFTSTILEKGILNNHESVLRLYLKNMEINDLSYKFNADEKLLFSYTKWNILKNIYVNTNQKYWKEIKVLLEETPFMTSVLKENKLILKNIIKIDLLKNKDSDFISFLEQNYNLNLSTEKFTKEIINNKITYKIDRESFLIEYGISYANRLSKPLNELYEITDDTCKSVLMDLSNLLNNEKSNLDVNLFEYKEIEENIVFTTELMYEKIVDSYLENFNRDKNDLIDLQALLREIKLNNQLEEKIFKEMKKKI